MLTRSLEGQKKVETYYYDIRKQVFEYDEVMNNQRRAVYSERRRVLDGRALKKQVIGYGERTMVEIVEAYNPDLPPEEWDLDQLVGKVKEFIYLLEDLTSDQVKGLGMEELKAFLHEQLRNAYDLKEGQVEQQRPGLMREADASLSFSRSTLLAWHHLAMDALRESVGLRGYVEGPIEYKNEGYDMFEMMTSMRRNVIYSMFMFQLVSSRVSLKRWQGSCQLAHWALRQQRLSALLAQHPSVVYSNETILATCLVVEVILICPLESVLEQQSWLYLVTHFTF